MGIADCRRARSHVPDVPSARASDKGTKSPISCTVLSHPHRRSSDVITAVLLAEQLRGNRSVERSAEGKHSLNLYLLITSFPLRHCTADHAASYLLGGAACSASTWMTSCVASLADKKKCALSKRWVGERHGFTTVQYEK